MFEDIVSKVEVDTEQAVFEAELMDNGCYYMINNTFSKKIKILKVTKKGANESVITYLEDENENKVCTNKNKNYFLEFINSVVSISGVIGKKGNMDIWYICSCYDISDKEQYYEALKNIDEAEVRAFDKKINNFKPEIAKDLTIKFAKTSRIPRKQVIETPVKYNTLEEMRLYYDVVKQCMLPDYRAECESCMLELENKPSSTEKQILLRVIRKILEIDWVNQVHHTLDIETVMKRIYEEHIGHKAQLDNIKTELLAFNISGKAPVTFNIIGRNGGTSIAEALAKAMNLGYSEVDLSGASYTDMAMLTGSSRIYENGRQGLLWDKLSKAGPYGVIVFKHIDQYDGKILSLLRGIISKDGFEDGFMQLHMDLTHMWIICTCNSVKDIPISIRNCTKEIYLEDLSDETILKIINDKFIPHFCNEYGIRFVNRISLEVAKILLYQMAKNDMHKLKNIIREIVIKVVSDGKTELPKFTSKNIKKYGGNSNNVEEFRHMFAVEPTVMENKFFNCFSHYPESIRSKVLELLDVMNYSANKDEKEYSMAALKYLVNILAKKPPKYKMGSVEKAINKIHYGQDEYSKLLEDAITANEYTSGKNGVVIIGIYGAPGTGKTSSCQIVANALKRDYVKISLGGVNSPQFFRGTGRSYKNAEPGIIPRVLACSGSSLSSVILLDEVDKMEISSEGNPYNPLHELLDPNQDAFYDEYLDCFIPKNNLIFILTFNDMKKMPETLLDRMRIIKSEGYSLYEKKQILNNYISVKIAEMYHLESIDIEEAALNLLVDKYSVDAGVRDCEKDLDRIVVNKLNNISYNKIYIKEQDIEAVLGLNRICGFNDIPAGKEILPGQAQALAVSESYGICFAIQTMINEYQNEDVKVTGLPEGSCLESVHVAMCLASRYLKRKLPNLYIHLTDSGIKKDGPSAGLAIFCSIMSCILNKPLPNVAFTGAIDPLYGAVRMVGNVEEKIMAAERNGVNSVYVPYENYEGIVIKDRLNRYKTKIIPVKNVADLMDALFTVKMGGDSHDG